MNWALNIDVYLMFTEFWVYWEPINAPLFYKHDDGFIGIL